jgi:AcrR family transcriptional regulator
MLGTMTRAVARETRGEDARRRLIAAVLDLLRRGGVEAVSARRLGELAGVSASAMNYHFGGRDGLLGAAFGEAAEAAAAWRREALEAAPEEIAPGALAGWLAALVQDACDERAYPASVLRELRQVAGRSGEHAGIAALDLADADAFWAEVAARAGLEPGAGTALGDFAAGALAIHGRAADWRVELPWLTETCVRLTARLAGWRDDLPGWDGWRAQAQARAAQPAAATQPGPASVERMLDAAVALVGEAGAEGLTHRAVALRAGASLAGVTHHFPTRAALVRRTFRALYDRVRASAPPPGPEPLPRLGPQALAREIAEALVDDAGAVNRGVLGLNELMLAAARDPALRAEVGDLRAARGEGGFEAIRRLDVTHSAPDRLDAHMASATIGGAIQAACAAPPPARREMLAGRLERSLTALFA